MTNVKRIARIAVDYTLELRTVVAEGHAMTNNLQTLELIESAYDKADACRTDSEQWRHWMDRARFLERKAHPERFTKVWDAVDETTYH